MNTQEYVAMKSDEQLDYMDTAAADELFALVDALFAKITMSKQGKKPALSGDDSGTALIKANKYTPLRRIYAIARWCGKASGNHAR